MEETDSERNIRLGQEAGATVVSASGTAIGMHGSQNENTRWKRDQVDTVVEQAISRGVTDPDELKQIKMNKIEELGHI